MLALNLPYGSNDALARAFGVLLKQSWLKAVLQRVAERPGGDFRSAAFVCDEYQNFATVGTDDPGGSFRAGHLVSTPQPGLSATLPLLSTVSASALLPRRPLPAATLSTPGPLPPALLAKTKTAAGRIWHPPSARSSTHGQAALPFNALSLPALTLLPTHSDVRTMRDKTPDYCRNK